MVFVVKKSQTSEDLGVFFWVLRGSRREHQTSRRSIPSSLAGALGFVLLLVGLTACSSNGPMA